MAKDRLTPSAWIDAGLSQLAEVGPAALRAEPLARHLNTTKGSFYWHFKDVPAFHAALLGQWKARAFASVVSLIAADGATAERLRRFGQHVLEDPSEPALRAWSLSAAEVADTLAQVDAERLTYLRTLLGGLGVTNDDYAHATYAVLIGLRQTGTENCKQVYGSLIDLILALR